MDHHFDIELACEVGVEKAILLHNLVFWIQHNEANDVHNHDGRFWTYNSAKAFSVLMPYLSLRSISRWMKELEKDGYILSSSELNATAYDRTKWYALGPKMENRYSLPEPCQNDQSTGQDETLSHSDPSISQPDPSIGQNDQSNGQNDQPIPYIKPDSKPDPINTDRKYASFPENFVTEGLKRRKAEYTREMEKRRALAMQADPPENFKLASAPRAKVG